MKGGKMTIDLTPEEKKTIVEQHLKTVLFSEYNLTLSLIEANALTEKNQSNIDSLNKQMSEVRSQKSVLQQELDTVNAEITTPSQEG
jgi:uncharacterized coiled-coil DUF342 family protein